MSKMYRKDFRMIAANLAKIEDDDTRRKSAEETADELAKTNPDFNRAKFLAASKADEQ
jgi:hypothetical protein